MPQGTIDVKMPDGTVITGVPEGTRKSEVMRRYQKMRVPPAVAKGPEKLTLKSGLRAAVEGPLIALAGVGQGAIDIASTPLQTLGAELAPPKTAGEWVARTIPGGLSTKRMVIDPMQQLAEKARKSQGWQRFGYAAASGIPLIGPMAAGLAESISKPEDIPFAAGRALAWTEAPNLVPALGRTPEEFAAKGTKGIAQGTGIPYSPEAVSAAERVGTLAPQGAARESLLAARDLDIAKADLAKISRELPQNLPRGSEGTLARAVKIADYMDNLWERSHKQPIERHADLPIDNKAIIEQIQRSIPQEAIENAPAEAKAAARWAMRNFQTPRTLASADALLREINADVKSPAAQTAYGPLLLRTKQLAAGVLRDQIDLALEHAGETGIREANRRWGALRTVGQRMTESALTEAERSGNMGLFQRGMHTYGYFSSRSILPHGGMALTGGMFRAAPSTRVARGMYALGRSGLEPPSPPADTTPTPPVTPPVRPSTQPVPQGTLPPVPTPRTPVQAAPPTEAAPVPTVMPEPPPPPDPYAGVQQRIAYTRTLNRAINKLSRGARKALSPEEIAWAEQESGLSLRDPANLPKVIAALRAKLKGLSGLPPVPKPRSQ